MACQERMEQAGAIAFEMEQCGMERSERVEYLLMELTSIVVSGKVLGRDR